ncbi:MAG: sodium-dependent bicarbonate transport family permease [Clostridia bacterium]|nr:sodium-dependent bicarbonate transport family permease [Clostridia bacterium]
MENLGGGYDIGQVIVTNLLSAPILFFLLGFLMGVLKSDFKEPEAMGTAMSIFLLVSIGLKAGIGVNLVGVKTVALLAVSSALIGSVIAIYSYFLLLKVFRLDHANAGSMAGHYGAVSSATLVLSMSFLEVIGVPFEAYMAAAYPFMDVIAIVTAIVLARLGMNATAKSTEENVNASIVSIIQGAITSRVVLLMVGSVVVGFLIGKERLATEMAFFDTMFRGVLTLFLLGMGNVAASRLHELRHVNKYIILFAMIAPLINGSLGVVAGSLIGLSPGGCTVLAAMAAGASYVTAPVEMRAALPSANPSLGLVTALGITFPVNVAIGLPLYYRLAETLVGVF